MLIFYDVQTPNLTFVGISVHSTHMGKFFFPLSSVYIEKVVKNLEV